MDRISSATTEDLELYFNTSDPDKLRELFGSFTEAEIKLSKL